jgi:cell wall-associated NlpC family hydrolase
MTFSGPLVIAATVTSLVAVTGTVAIVGVTSDSSSQRGALVGSLCSPTGPIDGLSAASAANARVVAATAAARGGHDAAVIALMTGLAESGLRVLANPNDPDGAAYAHDGSGSDHDSLGIFQQRRPWGPASERMDPTASTNLFLDRLLAQRNWQLRLPWEVVQAVQASAFADGSNYRAQLPLARRIADYVAIDARRRSCGGSADGALGAGSLGRHGLPDDYAIPPGTSAQAATAVTFALTELGKPYVFGANGPAAYDCSSLMVAAWAAGGRHLTRTTYTQMYEGTPVTEGRLAPGDLVLIPGSDGTLSAPGHVGMYIGRGLVVQAPKTGDVVKVVTYLSMTRGGVSALRHIA